MQRSNSQKVGSQGQRLVMSQIEDHPHWLVRDLSEDFGIDAEAELTIDGVNGHILKLQFKSSKKIFAPGPGTTDDVLTFDTGAISRDRRSTVIGPSDGP
jgi:hypothetical protein